MTAPSIPIPAKANRRRAASPLGPALGPVVPAAAALQLQLVVGPPVTALHLLLAVGLAAVGFWLRRWRPGVAWLFVPAAVGSLLGISLTIGAELRAHRAHSGLPLASVDSALGYLVADTAPGNGHTMRYRLHATEVASGAGRPASGAGHPASGTERAAADLVLELHIAGAERRYQGQSVAVSGVSATQTAGRAVGRATTVEARGYRGVLATWRARLRPALELALDRQGPGSGALLRALMLGDRFAIDLRVADAFRGSGSMHLLALSGLHVGMAWGAAWLLAGAVRWPGIALAPEYARSWDAVASALAVAAVVAYVWLAGPRPSLLRAATMVAISQAARLVGTKPSGMELLAASSIVVTVANPSATTALSFQLSFLALTGILLLGPRIALHLPGLLPPGLRGALGVAFGAQLFTLPLVLHTFGAVRPVGAVAGLLLIPLTALFLMVGVLALVADALTAGATLALSEPRLGVLYNALVGINRMFAVVPGIEL